MDVSHVNLYNIQGPISQELGFRWSQGFQTILETPSIQWISTSHKIVKSQKDKNQFLASKNLNSLMKLFKEKL